MMTWMAAAMIAFSQPAAAAAQPPAAEAPAGRVTVEYYYRIKWGGTGEFKRLYERNHAPLLREMQKGGYIVSTRTDEPFTHMAGGVRWDLRVTIVYRDGASALFADPAMQKAWQEAEKRLYPDSKKFGEEETRRFSLLEEHWDVVLW